MKINEKKLIKLNACKEGVEMFRQYPGLEGECAELGALCRWAASEGEPGYVRWLLPRLMTPEGAVKWVITAAMRHCDNAAWIKWADGWLSDEDRTEASAEEAWMAARAAEAAWTAEVAAAAAWAAAQAARAAWAAARTAVRVAEERAYIAAEDETAEIKLQIDDALEILSVDGKKEKAI